MSVYFDNASSTPLALEVKEEMIKAFEYIGNPSSIHKIGRESKVLIENARKKIAQILNASPGEIVFTSGGTEAINTAIYNAVLKFGVKKIITSRLEHPATLNSITSLSKSNDLYIEYLVVNKFGELDFDKLEDSLRKKSNTLVALMHANNEIGNLINLDILTDLCKKHNAILFSDTIQTIGHYNLDLQKTKLDLCVCSGHKFYGPKGAGFLYANGDLGIEPLIYGGSQERNMRAGTENVPGIVGLAKALELAYSNLEEDRCYIESLKKHMITYLIQKIDDIKFNGLSSDFDNSLYTVLNVLLPKTTKAEMLLFNLDIEGICVSGGSACSSGSSIPSHVLAAINSDEKRSSIRFSFSRYNTKSEIEFVIDKLAELLV